MKEVIIICLFIGMFITAIVFGIWGNYWFPGKEGIVYDKKEENYKVYKYNRYLWIPTKDWYSINCRCNEPNTFLEIDTVGFVGTKYYGPYTSALGFDNIERAKAVLTSERKLEKKRIHINRYVEVYSSNGVPTVVDRWQEFMENPLNVFIVFNWIREYISSKLWKHTK